MHRRTKHDDRIELRSVSNVSEVHIDFDFSVLSMVTSRLLPWGICLDTFDDFLVVDKAFEEFLPFFG